MSFVFYILHTTGGRGVPRLPNSKLRPKMGKAARFDLSTVGTPAPTLARAKSTNWKHAIASKPLIHIVSEMAFPVRLAATVRGQDALMTRSRPASRPMMVLGFLIRAGLTVIWATGCSRQIAAPGSAATGNRSQLPFDRVSDNGGVSPTAGFTSDGIPAGTEISIQLQEGLSSADSRVGDPFQAVLDEPLVVAGRTLAPRGTPITGSVVAAKASGSLRDPGYLRLTLTLISLNGKSIPLHSSSIFAKGAPDEKRKTPTMQRSGVDDEGAVVASAQDSGNGTRSPIYPNRGNVRFSTGRRLTFRLAQPLHLQG